jgi:peptidoglycan/xylan/chitin deacetylase (PgdA/CDA1 family)
MMSATRRVEDWLLSGLERRWGRERLTVLAYHRINNPSGFEFFEPLISATPSDFGRQMDIVAERYNPISLAELISWMDGASSLPSDPVLVTFDDGYRDNLVHALPVLRERQLPAVLFLPTEHIGRDLPFFWDSAAYCFHHSDAPHADLPILGSREWVSSAEMSAEWINAVKREPQSRRDELTEQLGQALGVAVPSTAHSGQHLTWDEVRKMADEGFSFGSHTLSHPILTELSPAQARRELVESRLRLEEELNEPIRALAYPNGTTADFSPQIEELAKESGYSAAFTLVPGPTSYRELLAEPLAIRRIGVYLADTDRRFRAKLAGGGRVKSGLS